MSIVSPPLKKRKELTMDELSEATTRESTELCYNASPDMFDDCSPQIIHDGLRFQENEEEDMELAAIVDSYMQGSMDEDNEGCSWRGVSLAELQGGTGFWGHPQRSLIKPSNTHTVLCQMAAATGRVSPPRDAWDSEHVRMPFSQQSLYPVTVNGDRSILRSRWELVEEALLKRITSSLQLEAAIMSYNSKYTKRWDFTALHYFFSDVMEPEEANCFFSTLLPSIIQLALQLPELIQSPIPLLKQHQNHSLSLSQMQIASLLANAFLCTFPRRNTAKRFSEYASFPDINFNRLFQMHKNKVSQRSGEKLKCLFHYFRRVCNKAPKGNVTFTRSHIPVKSLPQWDRSNRPLCKLHITSKGTIENQGHGMLQVDFANKRVGGGVLGLGYVQEEIRFIICPELIVARLFTESLDATEALHITGCERFSDYTGYADSFEWVGDHQDSTPRDTSGRLMCSIVAIDAMPFRNPSLQYTPQNLFRELNKAYAGFHNTEIPAEHLSSVATGNWGCGAFRGNARLKAVLQLMAATQAGRHLAYFTFGDKDLRDQVFHMYSFLTENHITVGKLWQHLSQYNEQCYRNGKMLIDLYPFIEDIRKSKSGGHKGPLVFNLLPEPGASRGVERWRSSLEKDRVVNRAKGHDLGSGGTSVARKLINTPEKKPNSSADKMPFSSSAEKRFPSSSSADRILVTNNSAEKKLISSSYSIEKKPASSSNNTEEKAFSGSRNSEKGTMSSSNSVEKKLISSCNSLEKKLVSSSTEKKPTSRINSIEKSLLSGSSGVEKKPVESSSKGEHKSSGSGSRRESLIQSLEQCDRKTTSPVPKRKISDYFNQVNIPK